MKNEQSPTVNNVSSEEFPFGRDVAVPRSDMTIDSGWKIAGADEKFVYVIKPETNEVKQVEKKTLRAVNWKDEKGEKLSLRAGDSAQVLRSNWTWDPGWKIVQISGDKVSVEKPTGDGKQLKKTVPLGYVLEPGD